MQRERIEEVVIKAFKDYMNEQDIEGDIDSDTALVGSEAPVDSMGLVNVVMDIESYFHDQGFMIIITSEGALSLEGSEFRTVNTLTDFILELIEGARKQSDMKGGQ